MLADPPPPPVPADADLTDFAFMPLYIERLRKSKAWLACKRRPELAYYLLNLWMRAWHEVPAASIEDDEEVLADAAGADAKTWAKIRADVMRGWYKASDGRLYHPVVAELAADAWGSRKAYQERAAKAREAKRQKRNSAGTMPVPANDTAPVTVSVTELTTALKGQGEGEGQGEGDSYEDKSSLPAGAGRYAFEGQVVRLKPKDYDAWKAAFHAIPDLNAELTSIDAWLAGQPDEKRKGWFHATAGMLSRRHQEHLQKRKPNDKPRAQAADWDKLPLYFDEPTPAKVG